MGGPASRVEAMLRATAAGGAGSVTSGAVRDERGIHNRLLQTEPAGPATQNEGQWRRASASRCRWWNRPPAFITNTVAATSTAAKATSTTAATRARIAAAAARAYSRRELMTSAATPEVRVALAFTTRAAVRAAGPSASAGACRWRADVLGGVSRREEARGSA